MDEKSLFKELSKPSGEVDVRMQLLQAAIGDLFTQLSNTFPKHAGEFIQAQQSLNKSIDSVKSDTLKPVCIFQGKGTVARRLKEHVMLHEWLGSIEAADSGFLGALKKKIEQFDLQPLVESSHIKELADVLNSMLDDLDGVGFAKAKPMTEFESVNLHKSESAIYSATGEPGASWLVLNVKLATGVKVCFIHKAGMESVVWYYHPYEDVWCSCNFSMSFAGLTLALQKEFALVFKKARPIKPEPFDVEDVLENLRAKAKAIFEKESYLPTIVQDTASQEIYFIKQNALESSIMCSHKGVWIHITDTRGQYPNFVLGVYTSGSLGACSKMDPARLPKRIQKALMDKALNVFGELRKFIDKALISNQAPVNFTGSFDIPREEQKFLM